jgi:hypothetical protein
VSSRFTEMAITAFRSQRAMTKMLYSSVLCSGGSATGLERRRAKGLATGARGDDSHTEELSESWEEYNSGSVGTMSSETGRNDPCGCGSGKKYKDCCGTPQFEVASVRVKDVKDVELTPGLADAFTASLDASYLEYFAAACSGLSTKEAERQIAAIPEGERYLTRVLDSLDNAFADFDTETAKLDLPNMQNRKPEAIKRYLEFRLQQFKMLLDTVEDFVEEKYPTTGGHS